MSKLGPHHYQPSIEPRHRTWVHVFVDSTNSYRDCIFVRHGQRQVTYGEFRTLVDNFATGLLRLGVRPGQVVSVWMTNSIEFLIAQWAVYRAGCTLLPLYSYYREVEIAYALKQSGSSVLITNSDFAGKVEPRAILANLMPELLERGAPFASVPDLQTVIGDEGLSLPGVSPWEAVLGEAADPSTLHRIQGRLSPADVMNVMYTSGTTGSPKAGLSLHSNNLASIREWSRVHPLGPRDVILCHVPMFTNFGCLYANALAMYTGAALEVTSTFDAAQSLDLIRTAGVTYIPGSPEIFRLLLDHPDASRTDFGGVIGAHVAGSAVDEESMVRILRTIPRASQAYGMSECGGVSTMTTPDDEWEYRLSTVGRPLASVIVRIVDPNTGRDVDPGEVGEVWFGDAEPGSCVGGGYLNSPAATSAAITADGWFRSGDLARLNDAGYLVFSGRLKNMITVGGFNVYPAEVEKHLLTHPDVIMACVVGVPSGRLGTVPYAFVVAHPERDVDEEELLTYMRDRVSSQKRPRRIQVLTQEQVPMTPSGKIRVAELEKRALLFEDDQR